MTLACEGPTRFVPRLAALSLVAALPLWSGCRQGPPPLRPPQVDIQQAASLAFQQYDTNGDSQLDSQELRASPGLRFAQAAYDTNGDSRISREELVARLTELVGRKVALTRLTAIVTLDGRPLADASVRLVPEPYLGDELKPASGTTDARGGAALSVDPAELPPAQQSIRGIQYGTYRVQITHPTRKLPSRYQAETELGYETQVGQRSVEFKLKSQ